MLTESQQRERQKAIAGSLSDAGIGRAFHSRTLSELSRGAALKAWVESEARTDIPAGKAWNIVGPTAEARDTMILLARGMHLSGYGCRVVPLRRLVAQIVHNGDLMPEITGCMVLCVVDFVQVYPGQTTPPLTGHEVQITEAFLHERLDEQQAVCVHASSPITGVSWWSPPLVQRLHTLNQTLDLSTPMRVRPRQ